MVERLGNAQPQNIITRAGMEFVHRNQLCDNQKSFIRIN